MLYFNDEHPWKPFARPSLVEIMRLLLLDFVVSVQIETRNIVAGVHLRVGRLGTETVKIGRKMPVVDAQRIAGFRVRVEAFGQQDMRTQIHGLAPEFGQFLALDADVLYIFGVFGRGQRRVLPGQRHRDFAGFAHRYFCRNAVEIARSLAPVLAFAPVGRQLECAAVLEFESFVFVQQCLHNVFTFSQFRQAFQRIAEHRGINGFYFACLPTFHIHAKNLRRFRIVAHLVARFGLAVFGKHDQQPPIKSGLAKAVAESNGKPDIFLFGRLAGLAK